MGRSKPCQTCLSVQVNESTLSGAGGRFFAQYLSRCQQVDQHFQAEQNACVDGRHSINGIRAAHLN